MKALVNLLSIFGLIFTFSIASFASVEIDCLAVKPVSSTEELNALVDSNAVLRNIKRIDFATKATSEITDFAVAASSELMNSQTYYSFRLRDNNQKYRSCSWLLPRGIDSVFGGPFKAFEECDKLTFEMLCSRSHD